MKAISTKSKRSFKLREWSGQDSNGMTCLVCLQHQLPSSKPTPLLTESVISQPSLQSDIVPIRTETCERAAPLNLNVT